MRIGLDVDDVTCQFAGPANDFIASHLDMDPIEVLSWRWWQGYGERGREGWDALWRAVENDGFLLSLPPVVGAIPGVKLLLELGHDVEFITHRLPNVAEHTGVWMRGHGLDLPVHHVRDKSSIPCDLYVDDKPDNIISLTQAGRLAYVFRQLWNADSGLLRVVDGWAEVLEVVAVINRSRHYCETRAVAA